MTRRRVFVVAILAIVSAVAPILLAECLTVGAASSLGARRELHEPPPPIVLPGALCGTTWAERVEPRLLAKLPLNLFDDHDVLVETVAVDEEGEFRFSPLTRGRYRLEPRAGFVPSKQVIGITDERSSRCDRPVFVKLSVGLECEPLNLITTTRPPGLDIDESLVKARDTWVQRP